MDLQFQVVDSDVLYTIPKKATPLAAGFDLYPTPTQGGYLSILPHRGHLFGTNLRVVNIPTGCYGRIAPRSGLSLDGIMVNAGVIDSDYTGELKILLHNISDRTVIINLEKAIAQLIIESTFYFNTSIITDTEVKETERGDKGFGSSDNKITIKRQKVDDNKYPSGYTFNCETRQLENEEEYQPLLDFDCDSLSPNYSPPSPPLVGVELNPGPPHLYAYRGLVYYDNFSNYNWHPGYTLSQKAWKHELHVCRGVAKQQWRQMAEAHGKQKWHY